MWTFVYTRLFSTNEADQSTVHLLCQGIVQTCLSFAVVGALERVGHGTFGGPKEVVRGASLLSFAKSRSSLPLTLSTSRPICTQHVSACYPPSLPLLPVLTLASVKAKRYSRAGIDATVLLRAIILPFRCFLGRAVGYHEGDNI